MKTTTYSAAIAGILSLMVMLVLVAVPAMAASQDKGMNPMGTGQHMKGAEAVVTGVDKPGNCLRVRSGPSNSDKEVACFSKGEKLRLNGMFSQDALWAQLEDGNWVFFKKIKTDLKAPKGMTSGRGASSERGTWRGPAGSGAGSRSRHPGEGQEQMLFWNFGYP